MGKCADRHCRACYPIGTEDADDASGANQLDCVNLWRHFQKHLAASHVL